MHLWILPSNWQFFLVNPDPFDSNSDVYAFHCLPYGPSHCPRVLEITLQWLIRTHMKVPRGFELWSYMDDLFLYAHTKDMTQESKLKELCEKYDLPMKPTKRQRLDEGDARALGLLFTNCGRYIALPPDKLKNFRGREPLEGCSYADLLGTLGTLEESPVLPAWIGAIKHLGQSIVARERASTGSKWSSVCSPELRSLIEDWFLLVLSTPITEYKVPRLYNFRDPLYVYTDASTRAGGFILRQHDLNYSQTVYVFSTTECRLPIVCLEAHILYEAFAAVHQLEEAARQRFDQVFYYVDNVAVEVSFRVGRPAAVTGKDAKPIVNKYIAMTNALYDPSDFGRRIFIERISTKANPADDLTRHPLLTKYIRYAVTTDLFVCSISSLVSTSLTPPLDTHDSFFGPDVLTIQVEPLPSESDIAAAQKSDFYIQAVIKELHRRDLPEQSLPSNIDKGFLSVWNTLLVRNGMLMRHLPATRSAHPMEVIVVPVLPQSYVQRVLVYFHNPEGANHPGIQRLTRAVKNYCWFPRMAKTICAHVLACSSCRQQHMRYTWTQTGVQRAAPPTPWHTVAADTVSLSTPKGNYVLLTTLCLYSQWPEVRLLQSKTSKTVASALKSINSMLGPMRILCTDRGSEFRGEVESYLKTIGASHSVTLSYSPLAAIEQLNRTIIQKMQTVIYSSCWASSSISDVLNDILWSLRSTPSSVHSIEPFTLMFCRRPHDQLQLSSWQRSSVYEYVEDLLAERRASAMARRQQTPVFKPGTLVFVRLHQPDRQYKVARRWEIMHVLRQEGVKVYLLPRSSKTNNTPVIERHVRECLPVPSGFADSSCQPSPYRSSSSGPLQPPLDSSKRAGLHVVFPVRRPQAHIQQQQQQQPQHHYHHNHNYHQQQQQPQQQQRNGGLCVTRSGRRIKKPKRYGFH